jgi:hypothetical protein
MRHLLGYCPLELYNLVTHDGNDALMGDAEKSREYPCLLRATNGKEIKFSTQVRSVSHFCDHTRLIVCYRR